MNKCNKYNTHGIVVTLGGGRPMEATMNNSVLALNHEKEMNRPTNFQKLSLWCKDFAKSKGITVDDALNTLEEVRNKENDD